ncbi:MAG: hypothetical protein PVJ39_21060 [Gammaproteobacteria bacterium]|jgi:hypothetical protein
MKEPLINWNREDEDRPAEGQKMPVWCIWTALGVTLLAVVLYGTLFFLVPEYRQMMADYIDQLPIFSRIVLNIYQPFLMVFVMISISLMILFYLKYKTRGVRYKAMLALIVANCMFAAILFGVTRLGLG